jgi:RHS repeat-associated protein
VKRSMKLSSRMGSLGCPVFLKPPSVNRLTKSVKRLTVICLALFSIVSRGDSETPPVHVNRTLPKFDPPKTALEFSSNPTEEEFFRARVFAEPLVPIGGEPSAAENAALANALLGYAKRSGPDDFSSLTGFLDRHPQSPWVAALLTDMGLEYYNTAHYSLALEAWSRAWELGQNAAKPNAKAIADRALGELAGLEARLGRVAELEVLIKSVEGRVFTGPTTDRIYRARGGLREMKERPGVSFRCGPLALERIKLSLDPNQAAEAIEIIRKSASTERGFSLTQVAELSQKVGLTLQMARRDRGAAFIVPAVVHWKVGHYAALLRQEGDRYLLQDPTFRNDVWATKEALEAETSGYFLVPAGKLGAGWKPVEAGIGDTVWGKGGVSGPDPGGGGSPPPPPCKGMAVSSVDLLFVSLSLSDDPVGYSPPVGPAVRFPVRYNQRDPFQPAVFSYSNLGPQWTFDWLSYITDNPSSPMADVQYYRQGGFARFFTGFDPATQSYAYQQYDQTKLVRTTASSYEMLLPDGSKLVFGQSDGSVGTSRNIFLTQMIDPAGNAVALTYDGSLRLVALTDAIGQVTTVSYTNAADIYKITSVTDPFGRSAYFGYDVSSRLAEITDVIGLTSQFSYDSGSDFVNALLTPYGTTSFATSEGGTNTFLETTYPDGSRERVEFNQTLGNGTPSSDPPASIPAGMLTQDANLNYRNTYYWSRTACATGYGDFSKARIYHWLHTADIVSAAGILESTKEPLEGRVWRDYAGQGSPQLVGNTSLPAHVGRVLDDGSTQLFTYIYDGFGHPTTIVDPVGRTFSYVYDTNGIDLLEVRMTRAWQNELLAAMTYNSQHLPLTIVDAAGQTNSYTYNSRGQLLTASDPKNETTTYTYDTNGYLLAVDGPLPGTNDTITVAYDSFGRVRTKTDVSGYAVTFDHDALDRLTKIAHPDGTSAQITYDRLDPVLVQDRAGRQTLLQYDALRQLVRRTDPLGRVTLFDWCACGDIKSLTDPMGRATTWHKDLQNRLVGKQYGDGSQATYFYENTTSRVRQVVDEKQQTTIFAYNIDNTMNSISFANAAVPTPGVSYTYDPDYRRVNSMTDGTGMTVYKYNPVTSPPVLGAGKLASETGPLPNDTITYGYDELGRPVHIAINGVTATKTFDAAGRLAGETNALGIFSYGYDGSSSRLASELFPNGLTGAWTYLANTEDDDLWQITYAQGATPISTFIYGHDVPANRITTWSQQSGAQAPDLYSLSYDDVNQLISATVTNSGSPANLFNYVYDLAGNRLSEQAGGATNTAAYNALNQLNAASGGTGASHTNQWDAQDRLVTVTSGSQQTELTYDGLSRLVAIQQLTNGTQASWRRFLWCGNQLCEERDASGAVTKRYFDRGMQIVGGTGAGSYFYTRDHLGSIRELTDTTGSIRARYSYDPYGRRTKLTGDLDADFGFAGMFWSPEAALSLARFRAYDPQAGRWLSRDPLRKAEEREGPNLYAYVRNNPVNLNDPLGLAPEECCRLEKKNLDGQRGGFCTRAQTRALQVCAFAQKETPGIATAECISQLNNAADLCAGTPTYLPGAEKEYLACVIAAGCYKPTCPAPGGSPPGPDGSPPNSPPPGGDPPLPLVAYGGLITYLDFLAVWHFDR